MIIHTVIRMIHGAYKQCFAGYYDTTTQDLLLRSLPSIIPKRLSSVAIKRIRGISEDYNLNDHFVQMHDFADTCSYCR